MDPEEWLATIRCLPEASNAARSGRTSNVFASRRGNWEVMARGGYYAKSLRNALNSGGRTAETVHGPSGDRMLVWGAAQRYRRDGDSVVVIAGDRYGMGSSRDWAAKVQRLLGVRAVLASSYERIHRSNLIGMGIMPLVVPEEYRDALAGLRAGDVVSIAAEADRVTTGARIPVTVRRSEGGRLLLRGHRRDPDRRRIRPPPCRRRHPLHFGLDHEGLNNDRYAYLGRLRPAR
jgi:aconitase A